MSMKCIPSEWTPELTIISIATGRYLHFWEDLVESSAENFLNFEKIQWVLLTDRKEEISNKVSKLLGSKLTVEFVPHSEWPMPTLLRYQYLLGFQNLLIAPRILYMDADMKAVSRISRRDLDAFFSPNEMTLVLHPGYFRQGTNPFFRFPRLALSDTRLRLKFGGLGTWETNKKSLAFVSRRSRKKYFCGGIWGGPRTSFIEFISLLSARVQADLDRGYIAKFHDESHLNWFAAYFPFKTMIPSWCYDTRYVNLSGVTPLIVAVDKNSSGLWQR